MKARFYKDQFLPWVGFYSVLTVRPEDLATIRLLMSGIGSLKQIDTNTEKAAAIANEFINRMIYAQ